MKFKNRIASLLVFGAMFAVTALPVSAVDEYTPMPCSQIALSARYDGSFAKAWELTKTWAGDPVFNLNDAFLTYGYNTFLINEDYAWAENTAVSHYAEIKNDNGWHIIFTLSA